MITAIVCIIIVLGLMGHMLYIFRHPVCNRMRGYSPSEVETHHLTIGGVIHGGSIAGSQEGIEKAASSTQGPPQALYTRH